MLIEIENFNIQDVHCKCGNCESNTLNNKLVIMLQSARYKANVPFFISSWNRCEKHNKKVGGKKDSSHLKGFAIDIKIHNSRDRFVILKSLIDVGFKRIGIGSNLIHIDIDTTKKEELIWTYK